METLKQETIEALNEYNQKWIENIKGEKMDITTMFGEYSKLIATLDKAFKEANERKTDIPKKGFFKF